MFGQAHASVPKVISLEVFRVLIICNKNDIINAS